jgi:molybdopterin-binding protein
MKISARNQISSKIVEVVKGAITAHVKKIDIGSGTIITASITNAAVDDLQLKAGGAATVIVKASDVMVGVS